MGLIKLETLVMVNLQLSRYDIDLLPILSARSS